ncbi:MAG: hypothetical protein R2688_08050 [Fimbriimonadaceae bacterium]
MSLVTLHPGCEVAVPPPKRQITVILSGKVKWILGDEKEEVIVEERLQ